MANELLEEINQLRKELNHALRLLEELKSIVLSDKTNAQWLDEKEAAQMLGYKCVRTIRAKAKTGALQIDYTTCGRTYLYSRKSINKYLESHSTIISLHRR